MNQILDFGAGGGNDNNNYNRNEKPEKKKKEKENNSANYDYGAIKEKTPMSDKVVKVFAILMIILAIALIASGATSILKNKKDEAAKEEAKNNSTAVIEALIDAELDEITGKVTITVDSPIIIEKMIYSWDQDHDYVVSGENQTKLEEQITAPSGKHTLHVQVTDEQNNKTMAEFEFDSAIGADTTQPKITLVVTESKKLKVTATDDTSIAYVTYTWNQEETVTMTPEEDDAKEFEFELDIPKGKNTILVTAVDGSETGNAKTATQTIDGVTKPEINAYLEGDGSVLKIVCKHESGIKKIYYTFNENAYQWEAQEGQEAPKELEFTQQSIIGVNTMTIIVTSVDGIEAEFMPQWEYKTQEAASEETTSANNEVANNTTNEVNNNVVSNNTTNEISNNTVANSINN